MDFMLLSSPRSGSTWAANWLMSDGALCLHDPLSDRTLDQLDTFEPGCEWGISCTGAWVFPSWLAQQTCPRVIIERPRYPVERSLAKIGYPKLSDRTWSAFYDVPGPRFQSDALFREESAREIWSILRPGVAFNKPRYNLLLQMNVQVELRTWQPNQQIIEQLQSRMFA